VAVVAALELDDLVPASRAARETERGHRRLRPAVDHPHHLDRGDSVNDLLGHLYLKLGRRAVARPAPQGFVERVNHLRRSVAQNHRPPRADVINVGAPLDIGHRRAPRAGDEARRAADAPKRTHRRVDAPRHQLARPREQLLRTSLPVSLLCAHTSMLKHVRAKGEVRPSDALQLFGRFDEERAER
jgi:hypothetical protein